MAGWNEWVSGANMTLSQVLDALKSATIGLDVKDKLFWSYYKIVELAIKEGNANFDVAKAAGAFKDLASRLDASDQKMDNATARLSEKIGGGVKAEPEDLSASTLALVTGTGTVNLLSIPQDDSVTYDKVEKTLLETLKVKNKNLFDGTYLNENVNTSDGAVGATGSNRRATDYIPVEPNTILFSNIIEIAKEGSWPNIYIFYDANKDFLTSTEKDVSFTVVPENARYFRKNLGNPSFLPELDNLWISETTDINQNLIDTKLDNFKSMTGQTAVGFTEIFNLNQVLHGIIDTETGLPSEYNKSQGNRLVTNYLPIEPNKAIITNFNDLVEPSSFRTTIWFYDKNYTPIKGVPITREDILPPDGAGFIRLNLVSDSSQGSRFYVDIHKLYVAQTELSFGETFDKVRDKLNLQGKSVINVSDFDDGNKTDSEIIKQAMNFTPSGLGRTLLFKGRDFNIDEAILLPSHTTVIVDGVTIKQNDGVFDNVFRGDNLTINPENPYHYPLSISPIDNIYIYGINGAKIEGPDVNKRGVHPTLGEQDMVGDFWGWRTLQISLSKCENFEISGFGFDKTRCWAMSFDKCSHFKVRDINVTSNVKNGDGVNIRFGCHDFEVYNITGSTSDDSVAINTIDYFPSGSYVYPMEPSAFENVGFPIEDLHIYNGSVEKVHTTGDHHGVICLVNSGRKIFDIVISDIKEPIKSTRESVVKIYAGYGSGYADNDIHSIRINDVLSKGATYAVQVTHKVDDVWINKLKQENASGTLTSIANSTGVTVTND